jgi:hypothetical protein
MYNWDTKWIIRSRRSKKATQYNGQNKMDKRTKAVIYNTTQKTKNWLIDWLIDLLIDWLIDWLIDLCLTSSEQFFSYIKDVNI